MLVGRKHEVQELNRLYESGEALSRKTSVQLTLITTFGLRQNQYGWAFTNVITLDDLFVE